MQNAGVGLEDRAYMHDEKPLSPSEWLSGTSATTKLIVLNALVFVVWQIHAAKPFMFDHFTVAWEGLQAGRLWTLVTSEVSHLDLFHLLMNMFALSFVGKVLEEAYGGKNTVALYLFAAVLASLGHVGLMLAWRTPAIPAIGASGAVMAMLIVAALLDPRRRVSILFLPFSFPIWGVATVFVMIDLVGAMSGKVELFGTRVAHGGHLGGAVAGALWKLLDLRPFAAARPGELGPSLVERVKRAMKRRSQPRLRVLPPLPPEPVLPEGPKPGELDAATSERVDDLLRKINKEGIQALTAEERAFLEKASLRYKK